MKLLLDEMHAPAVAEALSRDSLDVRAVAGEDLLRGVSDAELLALAAADGRALVTENVRDFMRLHHEWVGVRKAHAGIVLTRPRKFGRARLAYPGNLSAALVHFLQDPGVRGESWVHWL